MASASPATAAPEHATSGKKQRERIEDLAAACSRKIATEILPALRARAATALGNKGWDILVDSDDSQTLRFTYPSDVSTTTPDAYVHREVKIEFGARSDDWPAEDKSVVPYVAELLPGDARGRRRPAPRALPRTYLLGESHDPPRRSAPMKTKATPQRFSRHYADLAALAALPSAAVAVARDELRARVVEHSSTCWNVWAV